MKKHLRQIVVEGKTYLWKFTPVYVRINGTDDGPRLWECQDKFTAYLKSAKRSPLQVYFRTWEDPTIGGPLHVGAPLDLTNPEALDVNLHTPGRAAWLIRQGLEAGWMPEQHSQPFIIEQGVQFLIARLTEDNE